MNLAEIVNADLPVREHRNPVRAVKIEGIGARRIDGCSVIIEGVDEALHLTPAEADRLHLRENDYLVIYEDNSIGCSPAVAFEELAVEAEDPANPPLTVEELVADWDELDSDQDRAEYHEMLSEDEKNLLAHALSDRAQEAAQSESVDAPPALNQSEAGDESEDADEEGGEDS